MTGESIMELFARHAAECATNSMIDGEERGEECGEEWGEGGGRGGTVAISAHPERGGPGGRWQSSST
jgi:hypothetical protein